MTVSPPRTRSPTWTRSPHRAARSGPSATRSGSARTAAPPRACPRAARGTRSAGPARRRSGAPPRAPVTLEEQRAALVHVRRLGAVRREKAPARVLDVAHEPGHRRAVHVHVERRQEDGQPHRRADPRVVLGGDRHHLAVGRRHERSRHRGVGRSGSRKNPRNAPAATAKGDAVARRPTRIRIHAAAAGGTMNGQPSRATGMRKPRPDRSRLPLRSSHPRRLDPGHHLAQPGADLLDRVVRLALSAWRGSSARFAWFSSTHSRANWPLWISARIFCISARVWSLMIRGPRV